MIFFKSIRKLGRRRHGDVKLSSQFTDRGTRIFPYKPERLDLNNGGFQVLFNWAEGSMHQALALGHGFEKLNIKLDIFHFFIAFKLFRVPNCLCLKLFMA